MNITETKNAIKYYKAAIKNAEEALNHSIQQDEQFDDFCTKYWKKGYTTLFYPHTQIFVFYIYDKDETQYFFSIEDAIIIYDETNTFDGIEDVAKELLEIVKRFY